MVIGMIPLSVLPRLASRSQGPESDRTPLSPILKIRVLKGLSYEIDFENVDENWQILAVTRAAAGFWIFQRHIWFLVEIKQLLSGKCENDANSLCNPIIFVPVLPASLSYGGSVVL